MLNDDPIARDLIAKALGKAADQAVRHHIAGITQEAQLTARIGQSLEATLDRQSVLGHRLGIRIVTQDIPDRGPGALEKYLGADLYVGIEVGQGKTRETKGFLVQAKLRRSLDGSTKLGKLQKSCKDMLDRTEASYVWLYDVNGVRVLNARQVVDASKAELHKLRARRASTLFAGTLECHEGSMNIGLPAVRGDAALRSALGSLLLELRTPTGIAVSIDPNPSLPRNPGQG